MYSTLSVLSRQGLLSLLVTGIFIGLLITIGTRLRKYNEIAAVLVLCGSISALALLYFQKHPETIDMLEDHPVLTVIGICISVGMLIYRVLKSR